MTNNSSDFWQRVCSRYEVLVKDKNLTLSDMRMTADCMTSGIYQTLTKVDCKQNKILFAFDEVSVLTERLS